MAWMAQADAGLGHDAYLDLAGSGLGRLGPRSLGFPLRESEEAFYDLRSAF